MVEELRNGLEAQMSVIQLIGLAENPGYEVHPVLPGQNKQKLPIGNMDQLLLNGFAEVVVIEKSDDLFTQYTFRRGSTNESVLSMTGVPEFFTPQGVRIQRTQH